MCQKAGRSWNPHLSREAAVFLLKTLIPASAATRTSSCKPYHPGLDRAECLMVEGELALALFGSVCVLLLFGFPLH